MTHGPRGRGAATDPQAKDPALRGRTYAIPFDPVWEAAVALAGGELPRWSITRADDRSGLIEALATTRLLGRVANVRIRVGLDDNAQTRVDAESVSRKRGPEMGAHRRRLARFFGGLDRRLGASDSQILDGSRESSVSS